MGDVVWHFLWAYFIYVKTNTSDDNVREYGDGSAGVGYDEIPINWFWDNMWHPTKGYTALGYFMTWLFYMLIALPGVIFYIWSLIEDEAAACEGIRRMALHHVEQDRRPLRIVDSLLPSGAHVHPPVGTYQRRHLRPRLGQRAGTHRHADHLLDRHRCHPHLVHARPQAAVDGQVCT